MFEFGRELRRRLSGGDFAPRHGLTGGDASLFELVDLTMLETEAKSADIAAGRAGARDPSAAVLAAARAWREVARRGGDPIALRKAAADAASAFSGFTAGRKRAHAAMARLEQARCAMLGAELFGDAGLEAAAETALREAFAAGGAAGALAGAEIAALEARRALGAGDAELALSRTRASQAPVAALKAAGRDEPSLRLLALDYALLAGERIGLCGMKLKDVAVLQEAARGLGALVAELDGAYEPLLMARAKAAHGTVLARIGETSGEIGLLADGAHLLAEAVDSLTAEQSPLDHALAQDALGLAMQSLGEATGPHALEAAVTAFDRALKTLRDRPSLNLRASIAAHRAVCLGRLAEATGDLAVLDAAELALKTELSGLAASLDPTAWAVSQLNLARLYETRAEITGRDDGARARAAIALTMALEVFGEAGQASLAVIAQDALERVRERV